jgi:hypothetical protein
VLFAKHLRERIRRGRIRCSVRVWTRPHVRVGGRYAMDDGSIVVESIAEIGEEAVTDDLARESGFADAADLMTVARHGRGQSIYLIRFRYLPPGAPMFDVARPRRRSTAGAHGSKR